MNHYPIHAYYHAFLVGDWENIVTRDLSALLTSGMDNRLDSINLGVVYIDIKDLLLFIKMVSQIHPNTEILFTRKLNAASPKILTYQQKGMTSQITNVELGEAETLLRMCFDAKNKDHHLKILYLFYHSKGVTSPAILEYTLEKTEALKNLFSIKINDNYLPDDRRTYNKIIRESIKGYVADWAHYSELAASRHFHYLAWNIFWIDSDFLMKFDLNKWLAAENASRFANHRFTSLCDRHVFAGFPIKLYSIAKRIEINRVGSYINFSPAS